MVGILLEAVGLLCRELAGAALASSHFRLVSNSRLLRRWLSAHANKLISDAAAVSASWLKKAL
jgi:hypothetical protein